MRALKFDRAGASPVVRLAFACGLSTDPFYVDAWKTFLGFVRMFQCSDVVQRNWIAYSSDLHGRRTFGPFAKFLLLLDFLDWRLVCPSQFEICPGVSVDLHSLDLRAFRPLFDYCWRQKLTQQVRHRQDFHDLEGINFAACFAKTSNLDKSQQELLDCVRDGTFFLSTVKSKYDVSVSELCECGRALDTLEHRALECPRMAVVRLKFLDIQRMWHLLPDCMTLHGLCPANPHQDRLWQALAAVPWDAPTWRCGPSDNSVQMLFIDGSCSTPDVPLHAVASWSVILASRSIPVGVGLLPGLCHSSGRAEIWALVMAVQWLIDHHAEGIIHVDSQYALDGAHFLQKTLTVPADWGDRDLWTHLLERLLLLEGRVKFQKVSAHLCRKDDMSETLQFETTWNGVADTNAKVARLSGLPCEFADVYRSLIRVHEWQKFWTHRCQTFLLELAQHHLSLANPCTDDGIADEILHSPQQLYNNPRDWVDEFPLNLHSFLGRSPAVCAFGLSLCVQISEWFLTLDQMSDHLQTITFLELFVGFYLDSKLDLPVRVLNYSSEETWVPVRSGHIGELLGRSLQSRVSVFRHVFDLLFGLFGIEHEWTHLAVPRIGIFKPLEALTIPWPRDLEVRVSASLARFTASRPIRRSRDLARSWP